MKRKKKNKHERRRSRSTAEARSSLHLQREEVADDEVEGFSSLHCRSLRLVDT